MASDPDGAGSDRPLRIGHLTTIDMSLALLLATELRVDLEAGHEVIGISAPGPYVARVEALGVRHVSVPSFTRAWDLRSDGRAARELWRTLRGLDLDVLHTHTPKAGVMGRITGRIAGIPAVVNTCHGLWTGADDSRARRSLVLAVEGIAAQLSHAELFQNAEDREALRWAVRGSKGEVVGNGVDLERFRFDPEGRAAVRREWGVRDEQLVIGTVGRLVAEKGIVELAEAARELAGVARFVWVGPRDENKADRIEGSMEGLDLVGARDDMPAVYSAFDVFVLPSHREGFSRSAMEAAACGRPMVLSDIRGCREIGTHDEHLLLVPPRDPVALRRAIVSLLDRPDDRARLGRAAEARSRVAFDQRAVARRSLETYARLIRDRRA